MTTLVVGVLGGAGCSDGVGSSSSSFTTLRSLALDGLGNLYAADAGCHSVRAIALSTATVTTPAGGPLLGSAFCPGGASIDGVGTNAQINEPTGIAADGLGNLYVSDVVCSYIRKVELSSGTMTTLAGTYSPSYTNGIGTNAAFSGPSGLSFDGINTLYIADFYSQLIRTLALTTLQVQTLAGTGGASGRAERRGRRRTLQQSQLCRLPHWQPLHCRLDQLHYPSARAVDCHCDDAGGEHCIGARRWHGHECAVLQPHRRRRGAQRQRSRDLCASARRRLWK